MRRRGITRGAAALLAMLGAGTACVADLPPLPSARIAVDTDLPVPRALARLRVDVFDEDGTWIDTRDFPRGSPGDFPASFGLFTADESRPRDVTVRLRGYAEGAIRDYRGHRPEKTEPHVPVAVPETLAELCASAPDLPRGVARTFRRGATPLTENDGCELETRSGSVAAHVTISEQGAYRFQIVDMLPAFDFGGGQPSLFLRRECARRSTEIACAEDTEAAGGLHLLVDLGPGRYALLVAGSLRNQPADVTLQWDEARRFVAAQPPLAPPVAKPILEGPRLFVDGRDATPATEPVPTAAVDRLVRVHLTPGVETHVRFTLLAACAGVAPELAFDRDMRLDAARSTTCGGGGALEPLSFQSDGPFDGPPLGSAGSEDPCPAGASDDAIVCVPGGAFVLGDRALDPASLNLPLMGDPLRIVRLSRFYMDRRELTVGRYREARADGLAVDPYVDAVDVRANERATFKEGRPDRLGPPDGTWSTRNVGREAYPLVYVSWAHAREVCRFYGGDLPTEAQWEYAATAAGRSAKARFAWGDTLPTCDRVASARTAGPLGECGGIGPVDVGEVGARGDVTPLGIEGLGGNVAEHVRDAAGAYGSPCWSASSKDPWCDEPLAPLRVARGGSWTTPLGYARATLRHAISPAFPDRSTGFRCVYTAPPTRRWSGP